MMKPVRRIAAIIYLGMIIVVLAVAIAVCILVFFLSEYSFRVLTTGWLQLPDLGGLVLFLAFIQFVAAVWYAASYIPYGRKIIKGFLKKVCNVSSE
jgi:predicted membrane protein